MRLREDGGKEEDRGATTVTVMLGRGARRMADYPRGGTAGGRVQPERGAFQVGKCHFYLYAKLFLIFIKYLLFYLFIVYLFIYNYLHL